MGKFSELKNNLQRNKKNVALWLTLFGSLSMADLSMVVNGYQHIKKLQDKIELNSIEKELDKIKEINQQVGKNFNPYFSAVYVPLNEEQKDSLFTSLTLSSSEGSLEDNVCKIFNLNDINQHHQWTIISEEGKITSSGRKVGTGIFLSDHWVIADFHLHKLMNETIFANNTEITLLTANGEYVPADIVAYSGRDDLALLLTKKPVDGILPIAIAESTESNFNELTYALFRTKINPHFGETKGYVDPNLFTISTHSVDSSFFYNHSLMEGTGAYLHHLMYFTGNHPLENGDSGAPFFDENDCLQGIYRGSAGTEGNFFFYSTKIEDFLINYLTFNSFIEKSSK